MITAEVAWGYAESRHKGLGVLHTFSFSLHLDTVNINYERVPNLSFCVSEMQLYEDVMISAFHYAVRG
jgi:hypothetical protein